MVECHATWDEIIGERGLSSALQITQWSWGVGWEESRLDPRCSRINKRWGEVSEKETVGEDWRAGGRGL